MGKAFGLTEETKEVFGSVQVTKRLARVLTVTRLNPLMHFVELGALESIEENATERPIEVLLDASDDLFKEVSIRRSWPTVGALSAVVVLEKQGDRRGCWHGCELLLFRDLLPVIYQDGLERIGDEESNCWPPYELLFLLILSVVSPPLI